MRNLIALFVMVSVMAGFAQAAEITFTGRAGIYGGDVRAAQRNSLNSALLGGIKRYVQVNAPKRRGQITTDYFMFINSYEITARRMSGNGVNTTVRILIDDMILDDVSAFMTADRNSAVFNVTGLPNYVSTNSSRASIKAVFDKYQFTTNDQIAFEQEVVDTTRRLDVVTAFQVVGDQYLFDLKFNLKNLTEGVSCTLASEVSYIHEDNLTKSTPVISTETTIENADSEKCVLAALTAATDNALAHMRNRLVPAPAERIEDYTYNLRFTNIDSLLSINELMDTLQKRRLINRSEQLDFQGDETTFEVDSYLLPEDLAYRIATLQFSGIASIEVDESTGNPETAPIVFTMGAVSVSNEESGEGND